MDIRERERENLHMIAYLEDHPRTCKWLITIVYKSPKDQVVGPLPNGCFMAYKWG